MEALVAGIDSSTQSCKVVVCDAASGRVVRTGSAPHPAGTEVDPERWWEALCAAARAAGGLADVEAVAVAGQQHGMICLDEFGAVVRPALLWNDTRSAAAATELVDELGGPGESGRTAWARAVGSVPVASFTVTKLRWLAEHEPAAAARVAAVALPHDWLTWRLGGAPSGPRLTELVTDRSDASGTGYFDPSGGTYRLDLLRRALEHEPALPAVLAPAAVAGRLIGGDGLEADGVLLGPGALHGITLGDLTREGLARAAVEGVLCGLADGLDALRAEGVACERVLLVGGGARSAAVQRIAPSVLGLPVLVPQPGEYVATGAARQAAWALSAAAEPPIWSATGVRRFDADPQPAIRRRYADARESVLERL